MSSKSFLFCSLSNRPEFSKPMFQHLEMYCEKHNYKCVLENKVLSDQRAPAWSKILLIQREMKANPDIDTIVWVDDDILITNKDIKFDELIKPYPFHCILLSEDVVWSPFNCGMMVCKNNKETYDYLTTIWELCEQYPDKKFSGLWEQDILVIHTKLISFINPNHKMTLTVIPHNIIQSFFRDYDLPADKRWKPGHFSAHFTGMPMNRRMYMRDIVLKQIE